MTSKPIDLPQGTLDLLILRTLSLEPQHGWAISERIQQISSDVLRVQQGSLYPALHCLERRGLIKSCASPKLYASAESMIWARACPAHFSL